MQISSVGEVGSQPASVRPLAGHKPETGGALPMDEVAVTSTSEGPAAEAAPAAGSADSPAGNPSEVKSFAYGALGIDPRAEQTSSQNPSYTAGQWTGAALKVGGIIALLV